MLISLRSVALPSLTINSMSSEQPKTILYIESNQDGTIGGSYFCLLYIVTALDRSLYRPIVLFEAPCRMADQFRATGASVIELNPFIPPKRGKGFIGRLRQIGDMTFSMLRSVYVLARCLRILTTNKVQLIHLNNGVRGGWAWLVASKILRIPCITHQRDFDERASALGRFMAHRFTLVICVSQAVLDFLRGLGIRHTPMQMIHDAIDVTRMKSEREAGEIRQELGISQFSPVIGMVGNLQRWKGQWVLIEAIRKLQAEFPRIGCVLIGDVSKAARDQRYAQELRESIANYGLEAQIILAGYRKDVPNYLKAFDIIVHASTNPEPFGLVVLEAMAFKKPLVGSRAGGVREIVVEGTSGMLFTPGDADDLARALRVLLSDQEAAARMGERGYDRLIAEFTLPMHIRRIQAVYAKLLGPAQAA